MSLGVVKTKKLKKAKNICKQIILKKRFIFSTKKIKLNLLLPSSNPVLHPNLAFHMFFQHLPDLLQGHWSTQSVSLSVCLSVCPSRFSVIRIATSFFLSVSLFPSLSRSSFFLFKNETGTFLTVSKIGEKRRMTRTTWTGNLSPQLSNKNNSYLYYFVCLKSRFTARVI